jgi:hypothetical protein
MLPFLLHDCPGALTKAKAFTADMAVGIGAVEVSRRMRRATALERMEI